MFSDIFTLHDRTTSTILLTSTRVIADLSSSFLDRLLPHLLEAQLSSAFILSTIRISKCTLFPNDYPGPPPMKPTLEKQAEPGACLVGWRPRGALASRLLPLLLGPDPTKTLGSAPFNVILFSFSSTSSSWSFSQSLHSRSVATEAVKVVLRTVTTVMGGATSVGRDADSVAASEAS